MELPIPAWFKYRQGEAKPAGENCFILTAPQIEPAYIRIRNEEHGWRAVVSDSADGPDVVSSRDRFEQPGEAWVAAFELYRISKVI